MSARFRTSFVLSMVVVFVLSLCQVAQANYHAGNSRSAGYGVKAEIGTPPYAPHVDDWILSYVSTAALAGWVQTGWCIPGVGDPQSYTEYYIAQSYDRDWYSVQAYNYARLYEVVYIGAGDQWRALIQGTSRGSWGPLSAPTQVQAMSEVFNVGTSDLKATFNNVQYKGQYNYFLFNENNFYQNAPYWVEIFTNYKYNTHGNGM